MREKRLRRLQETSWETAHSLHSIDGTHRRALHSASEVDNNGGTRPLPEADKSAVRENLMEGIVRAPPAVRSQLGECAKYVLYRDYPETWPLLLPAVVQALSSQVRPGLTEMCIQEATACSSWACIMTCKPCKTVKHACCVIPWVLGVSIGVAAEASAAALRRQATCSVHMVMPALQSSRESLMAPACDPVERYR